MDNEVGFLQWSRGGTLMPRVLPLYVTKEKSRHGKIVFYFRIGKGERIRLLGVPGSREFKVAYQAALTGQHLAQPYQQEYARSLRWLIRQYMGSTDWESLGVATRKQRGLFYKQIVDASGEFDCRLVRDSDIREALKRRSKTPSLANNYLKAVRSLFKWARTNKHIEVDPTLGVERLKVATSDGFPIWTIEDIHDFMERWPVGTRERLALEILIASGLRRSDIALAGRQHMRDGIFSIKTAKTKTQVTMEFSNRVLEMIEQTETGDFAFIVGQNGRPMTKESFGNWFREACRAAGVSKSGHGLRKFSATLAADAGATTHELMAQFGWVTVQQAELYTKAADRSRLGKKTSRVIAEQIETVLTPHLIQGAGKNQKRQEKSKG
ncbi:tyrosine-type recombinase/integrase [Rhizobium leguminosarum]|uniref:tyrosine-type recombinase/integrase n=1 Tax=Rhizobium leguminosarum TaxID=384 RepID=UPI001C96E2BA|nr:tyrosine-type recombinase/integrase [Rhizobium leguminosarum]MBY5736406.1 tyrosine-type recombinase/integrase [Rhizobium leguminosarum]